MEEKSAQVEPAIIARKKAQIKVPLTLVFIVMVAIGLISAHFLSMNMQKNTYLKLYQNDVKHEMQSLIRSHFDTINYPKWQEVVDLGEKLVSNSRVRGGTIYSSQGEELASFGLRPGLNYYTAKNTASPFLFHEKEKMLDIFYKDSELGITEHIIFKVDVREYETSLNARIEAEFNLFLFKIGFSVVLCTVLFVGILILPMRKLASSMRKLAETPAKAENIKLNWLRGDVVGQIAHSIDILAKRVAHLYAEELAAAEKIIEKSAQAIVQFDADLKLIDMNSAAIKFFDIKEDDNPINIIASVSIKIKQEKDFINFPVYDIYKYGNFQSIAAIYYCKGERKCFINTIIIYDSKNNIRKYILVMHDLTKESAFLEKLEKNVYEKTTLAKDAEKRFTETKFLLESTSLALSQFTNSLKSDAKNNAVILPDRLLNKWYDEAHAAGLVSGRLEHKILPVVKGNVEHIESSLRQSLSLIYTRSKYISPVMKIDAIRNAEGEVIFSVSEMDPDKHYVSLRAENLFDSEQLVVAAGLKQALKLAEGRLIMLKIPGYENGVRFALISGERISSIERPALIDHALIRN